MKGWKTWASGITTILTGVIMIITAITSETLIDVNRVTEGLAVIAGGLAIIGIGHKIEKKNTA